MANTLAGLTLAQIAQMSLKTIAPELLPVRAFATDFSDEIVDIGGSVTTRYAAVQTAQDVSAGYTPQDQTTVARTISLNQNKGHVIVLTDYEASTIGLQALTRLFMEPARNAVGTVMMTDLLALVTAASYGASTALALASLDSDALADLGTALTVAKIPKIGRFALLNTGYYNALKKDGAIKAYYASGSTETLTEGKVGRVSGFDIYEYTEIPDNGENLAGIVGAPDALIIAARCPALPPNTPHIQVENVTDPDTGMSLQYRMWYEATEKRTYLTVESLYGVQIGNPAFLRRVKTA